MNSSVKDGDETTAIQRDDGTIVECVIHHWTL